MFSKMRTHNNKGVTIPSQVCTLPHCSLTPLSVYVAALLSHCNSVSLVFYLSVPRPLFPSIPRWQIRYVHYYEALLRRKEVLSYTYQITHIR